MPSSARALALVALVSGCQLSRPTGPEAPADGGAAHLETSAALLPPLAPETPVDDHAGRVTLTGEAGATLAVIGVPDCTKPAAEVPVSLTITSPFGPYDARYVVRGDAPGEAVRAEIEGYQLGFATEGGIRARLFRQACAASVAGVTTAAADAPTINTLREWVELSAPDCEKVTPEPHGWHCRLPGTAPEPARLELAGIQTTMIRRWSRQPYLLARRLAVGIALAHALEAPDVDKALRTFCKVVEASLPIELPATLASKRWQIAACGKKPERLEAARFGLAKTVAEVDFMRQLFERTSRLGFLALRIPPSQAPSREVLVNLTPEADVADNLTRETARLWLSDGGEAATPEDLPRSCWHPVYAESPQLLDLARHLAMAGEAARVACAPKDQAGAAAPALATERYFAESITSETEFVLTNGRAKTLRLPTGKYSYTLRGLPENPDEWDDAASQAKPKAAGEIVWDAKRPHPVITAW